MDLQPNHQQEATSSSSLFLRPPIQDQQLQSSSSITSAATRGIRSSARVKAAKQKERDKDKQCESTDKPSSSVIAPEIVVSRNTRSNSNSAKSKSTRDSSIGKGKASEASDRPQLRSSKRIRRTTLPSAAGALTIQEPIRDAKGKKRAAPESTLDEDVTPSTSSAKRSRVSPYSLRSKLDSTFPQNFEMPKKTRSSMTEGKIAVKGKILSSSSSRLQSDDVEMVDAEYRREGSEPDDAIEHQVEEAGGNYESSEGQQSRFDSKGGGEGAPEDEGRSRSAEGGGLASINADDSAAMNIFGDYRQFGSYMLSLSSRLKTMLNNITTTADPTTRLVTLQELSELLSISTEDTLAGSFQVELFVKELVKILGGRGIDGDDEDDGDDDQAEQDGDADLATALAMSTGGAIYQGDDNLEAQVLACRCLANLMEALPGVAHTVVYHGAIPVLCSKLIEISYIDLAEQTLSTLEKISEEFPSSIVREGGLAALLNYLDFFSIAVQRTALQAASNCCRNVSAEHFPMIHGVWPIIRNCLTYSDQRLVEFACLCVIRAIDSYHRVSSENLESLVDLDLIKAVNVLLLPAGGSPLIAANTYTLLLRALATSARASPKITLALLEADIVDTLYQILTGALPEAEKHPEHIGAEMSVMENLAHRPKDQVEEALSLISELMPPLPKDGVFDHKGYTEKSLLRMIKTRARVERAATRQASAATSNIATISRSTPAASASSLPISVPQEQPLTDASSTDPAAQDGEEPKEPPSDRTELLHSKPAVVGRFMQLMVPILIDVYAASVITPVRVKTLTGLLKAVSFLNEEGLKTVLKFVPIAGFASSILSSRDHPSLVIAALQLVDMLLAKVPTEYSPAFRREGVFHELDALASREISASKPREKDKDKEKEPSETPSSDSGGTPVIPPSASVAAIPGFKKLFSLSLEPEDAITLRSRVIRFKYLTDDEQQEPDHPLRTLHQLVKQLSVPDASEEELFDALTALAGLFASPHTSVSSFELLQSGLVDGLLQFAVDPERTICIKKREKLILDAFAPPIVRDYTSSQSSFATLVKKLQESLTKMESFEVVTVSQGGDDSKRSSPSLLARQLRLRLVAGDESDIPRNLHNIVVSIHAIATFQALHDYLRPRVAGLLSTGRLSGMLVAPDVVHGSSSRNDDEEPRQARLDRKPIPPSVESTSATAASSSTVGRRRSLRLSAKHSSVSTDIPNINPTVIAATDASLTELPLHPVFHASNVISAIDATPSDTVVDSELQADFTDDEVDAEVFDDDADPDNSVSEKTVTLSIAEDGSKVEAQTPEGTRVATPNVLPISTHQNSTKASYAATLKAKPTDWHLEFLMDSQILPLDLTIYGAIHQHEMRKKSGGVPHNLIWQGVYNITFKKIAGPLPTSEDGGEGGSRGRPASPAVSSLPDDAPHAKILRLLRVLQKINSLQAERSVFVPDKRNIPASAFVNNKLTAKLTRQLEEPMIVASSCLPDWALDLPQHFPFLFPFATRYNFLQSTSFGYARLILKWQSQQTRGQENSRRDDGIGFLGRLQRQKVRISRKHVLESAVKVFELYGSSSSILEVEYFEEAGTGLGPTLEFYSLVSKEFARRDLKIWRDADLTYPGLYVHHPSGLYPAPISQDDIANDGGQKRTQIFRVIGQFVAKAMLDSRIIDLSFNKIFVKSILGEEVPLTMATLKFVDIGLANSLAKLQEFASENDPRDQDLVKDLALDFTVPGYDIELRPGGRDVQVTSTNIEDYVQEVLDAIIGKGALLQAKAFREGFSKVFPIQDLQAFSADELMMLFGNSEEDWCIETLSEAIKADHGFHVESRAIRDLIEIMSTYDSRSRRDFLQFITGSPKLPIGGFRGLNPPLTVVRKPHESPLRADDYLPSVMTCVNYLKLPDYSSKAVMQEKLSIAIREGVGSFHLS